MLVLVRRCDESIVLRGDIVVTICAVDGDRVKLGIEAPSDITILRSELCDEVIHENRAAASSPSHLRKMLPALRRRLAGKEAQTP